MDIFEENENHPMKIEVRDVNMMRIFFESEEFGKLISNPKMIQETINELKEMSLFKKYTGVVNR